MCCIWRQSRCSNIEKKIVPHSLTECPANYQLSFDVIKYRNGISVSHTEKNVSIVSTTSVGEIYDEIILGKIHIKVGKVPKILGDKHFWFKGELPCIKNKWNITCKFSKTELELYLLIRG